ncbi:MAG TPA: CBS domain-containing protein [Verrucomicrobiae bacterium]|nr:CBS domain-containing protein [Verrucomicrobiae bacterium]
MEINVSIRSILSQKPSRIHTIRPDSTVFEAIQSMADKNIGALLVLEGNRLLGVISERDYTRKVALKGRSSKETPVREIIATPPVVATPEDSVEDCMKLMTSHRIRHLPVLQDGQLIGVVSIGDLINWLISAQNHAIQQLETYISGQYPG